MMRKNITRTLTRATVKAFTMEMENGLPVIHALDPVYGWGNITGKEAKKLVKDQLGVEDCVVGEIEFAQETYKIDINKFVENAEMVDISEIDEDEDEENEMEEND